MSYFIVSKNQKYFSANLQIESNKIIAITNIPINSLKNFDIQTNDIIYYETGGEFSYSFIEKTKKYYVIKKIIPDNPVAFYLQNKEQYDQIIYFKKFLFNRLKDIYNFFYKSKFYWIIINLILGYLFLKFLNFFK